MPFYEDIKVGQRGELGSFTFTAELIRKFASQFDPQRFHLDEEEGRKSLFGGLTASGWHVAAVCMKLMVAYAQRHARHAADTDPTYPSPKIATLIYAPTAATLGADAADGRSSMNMRCHDSNISSVHNWFCHSAAPRQCSSSMRCTAPGLK